MRVALRGLAQLAIVLNQLARGFRRHARLEATGILDVLLELGEREIGLVATVRERAVLVDGDDVLRDGVVASLVELCRRDAQRRCAQR